MSHSRRHGCCYVFLRFIAWALPQELCLLVRRFGASYGPSPWLCPRRRPRIISEDELLQNFALCSKPMVRGRLVAASTLAPKLVSARFNLLLHTQVILNREKGCFPHSCLDSLLHLVFPCSPLVRFREPGGFVTAAACGSHQRSRLKDFRPSERPFRPAGVSPAAADLLGNS